MSAPSDAEPTTAAAATPGLILPGRLGDPAAEYRSDPRANRRLRETLATLGLDAPAAPSPLTRAAPLVTQLEFIQGAHDAFEAVYAAIPDDQPAQTTSLAPCTPLPAATVTTSRSTSSGPPASIPASSCPGCVYPRRRHDHPSLRQRHPHPLVPGPRRARPGCHRC